MKGRGRGLKRLNALRAVAMLLCVILITPVRAETRVTVAQLEEFLTSKQAVKEPCPVRQLPQNWLDCAHSSRHP